MAETEVASGFIENANRRLSWRWTIPDATSYRNHVMNFVMVVFYTIFAIVFSASLLVGGYSYLLHVIKVFTK
jgi:hypothetical protein